jgi:threonine/homoserine/homoserine lactone efflux protein
MPADASVLAIFLLSFVNGLRANLFPGPLFFTVLLQGLRKGFWSAPSIVIGHVVLDILMVALLGLEFQSFLQQNTLIAFVTVPAAAVLIFMAWHVYKDAPKAAGRLADPWELASRSPLAPGGVSFIILGILATLANPFWFTWWTTNEGALLLDGSFASAGPAGIVAVVLGHLLADFGWFCAIGVAAAGGRQSLSLTLYAALLRAGAVFFIFVCGAFVFLGIQAIREGGPSP